MAENLEELNRSMNNILQKVQTGVPLDNSEIDFLNSQRQIPPEYKDSIFVLDKRNKGLDLNPDEQRIFEEIEKQRDSADMDQSSLQELLLPEDHRRIMEFQKKSRAHISDGGKRVIHLTDTEAAPHDLEKILKMNLNISGGFNKDSDVFVHTGDLLQDFIDFKTFHHGMQGFSTKRIVDEGGLEGKVAEEFDEVYSDLLKAHGISEYELLEGQPTEELVQKLQMLYFGMAPRLYNEEEKEEYRGKLALFEKHMKTAIKNNARIQYGGYKEIFEKYGLSPEDVVLIEGNHDVPEVMREVLGKYMPESGGVSEKKGIRFGNPLNGSTGQHMGPDYIDTFGYTDVREQLETIKYETGGFQKLKSYLGEQGIVFDDKELSNLIKISHQRASQGIGKGDLAKYFDERIKPEIDFTVNDMKGKVVNKVPNDVDFYLFHGMPNHPSFAGFEEAAAYKAIEEAGGGNILHGHIHGKTTHRMGNSLLLNQGDGKQGFGVYHFDKNSGVSDIFTQTYNSNIGTHEYEMLHKDQISVQRNHKEYS